MNSADSSSLIDSPAASRLGGHRSLHRPVVRATTEHQLERHEDGKLHLLRARLTLGHDGAWSVSTTGGQESHQLAAMADANALILLPDGRGAEGFRMQHQLRIYNIKPGAMDEYQRLQEAGAAAGKVRHHGDRTRVPPAFYGMHNELAELTA